MSDKPLPFQPGDLIKHPEYTVEYAVVGDAHHYDGYGKWLLIATWDGEHLGQVHESTCGGMERVGSL